MQLYRNLDLINDYDINSNVLSGTLSTVLLARFGRFKRVLFDVHLHWYRRTSMRTNMIRNLDE